VEFLWFSRLSNYYTRTQKVQQDDLESMSRQKTDSLEVIDGSDLKSAPGTVKFALVFALGDAQVG
jgi:hypothetical protein